jgi:hypothetical protein
MNIEDFLKRLDEQTSQWSRGIKDIVEFEQSNQELLRGEANLKNFKFIFDDGSELIVVKDTDGEWVLNPGEKPLKGYAKQWFDKAENLDFRELPDMIDDVLGDFDF